MAKKQEVKDIFNDIAPKYDALNHILSLNIDKLWRKKAMSYVDTQDNVKLLDVACGTGDFSIAAYKKGVKNIKGIDISKEMVEVGNEKIKRMGLSENISLHEGDSEDIKFIDNSFDYITVAFGVRNFENLRQGLLEMHRVLSPKGKLIVLEFSMPENKIVKFFYTLYFRHILPTIGGWISGNKNAYAYLPESVIKFPHGKKFLDIMQECKFRECFQKKLSLGIASLYIGIK